MIKKLFILIVCCLMMFIVGCSNGYKELDTKIYVLGNGFDNKNNVEEVIYNIEILNKYFSEAEKYYIIDSNEKYNEFIKLLYSDNQKTVDETSFFENNNKFIIYRDARSSNEIEFKYTYNFKKSLFHTFYVHNNEVGDTAMYKCIDVVDVPKKYGDIFYDFFHKGK